MNKRILSSALALCMVGSMLPAAALAAEAGPSAQQISISSDKGNHTSQPDGTGVLRMDIPNDAVLKLGTIEMVTTEAVTLADQSADYAGASNTIYGTGDGLAISVSVQEMTTAVPVEMTSANGVNWTGTGSVPEYPGVTNVTVGALANELGEAQITVAPGVLTAGGQSSQAAKVTLNQDAANVYLYLSPASLEEYEITFVVSGITYTFTQPAGTAVFAPQGLEVSGSELVWYSDANYTTEAQVGGTASSNMTFYGRYESETQTSFASQLDDPNATVLTIYNVDDFATFVARAGEVDADQVVMLANSLDLTDNTYAAISGFKGDFNGNGKTISGATFTAVNGNAGMFATLGAGQVVANLNLEGITVNQSSATYSGTLVGSASGQESAGSGQVTIQNVQVSNSTVRGRSAGGIAGFIIWTDVKYCSVTGGNNMSITGTVNAGGIVGISYNNVSDCYVIASPNTTLPILNDIGGIVGKNLDNAAHITRCWTTAPDIYGTTNNEDIVTSIFDSVTAFRPSVEEYEAAGFVAPMWNTGRGTATTFNLDNIEYPFD